MQPGLWAAGMASGPAGQMATAAAVRQVHPGGFVTAEALGGGGCSSAPAQAGALLRTRASDTKNHCNGVITVDKQLSRFNWKKLDAASIRLPGGCRSDRPWAWA